MRKAKQTNKEREEEAVEVRVHNLPEQEKELYILSRWAALFDAVDMIADTAAEKNIPFERVNLNPLDIRDYVDATSDIVMRKLLTEKEEMQKIS